jgi:SAM-dependent methyltransferase
VPPGALIFLRPRPAPRSPATPRHEGRRPLPIRRGEDSPRRRAAFPCGSDHEPGALWYVNQSPMAMDSRYGEKASGYFAAARTELFPLLPSFSERVLELGCGHGGTLSALRQGGRARFTVGVELSEAAAERARGVVDAVHCCDVEVTELPYEDGSFDALLCLDVLEHLVDPWRALARLGRLVKPGGVLLASIPNVQHHSVVVPLLLGHFRYREDGLLDRTHLRFFTREGALELVRSADFEVDHVSATGGQTRAHRLLRSLPGFRGLFDFQFLIRARRTAPHPTEPTTADPRAGGSGASQIRP